MFYFLSVKPPKNNSATHEMHIVVFLPQWIELVDGCMKIINHSLLPNRTRVKSLVSRIRDVHTMLQNPHTIHQKGYIHEVNTSLGLLTENS